MHTIELSDEEYEFLRDLIKGSEISNIIKEETIEKIRTSDPLIIEWYQKFITDLGSKFK